MDSVITSRKNETVAAAARLLSGPSARREQGAFLCEGARLCADAAKSGVLIRALFYTEAATEKYETYLAEIRPAAKEAYLISPHIAPLFSDTKAPQGVFCVCALPDKARSFEAFLKTPAKGAAAALEEVQDPANLGAVLRTAEALGVSAVLLCGTGCDPYSPKVLRGSMGAVFRLPLYEVPDLALSAPELLAAGWKLWAAVPDAKALPVTRADFSVPGIMAVGNEGSGLSKAVLELCEHITIPMLGRAESLNASASAAILLWEMMRGGGCGLG